MFPAHEFRSIHFGREHRARSRSVIPPPEPAPGLSDFVRDFPVLCQAVQDGGHRRKRVSVASADFRPLFYQSANLL